MGSHGKPDTGQPEGSRNGARAGQKGSGAPAAGASGCPGGAVEQPTGARGRSAGASEQPAPEGPCRAGPPDRRLWIDGEWVAWERATVHVLSHSHQRGALVFDYMSVHDTPRGPAVFRMRDHVLRFLHSCELVGLPVAPGAPALGDAVLETVRANPGAKAVKVSAYVPSIEIDVVPMDERVSVAIAAYDPVEDVLLRGAGEPHVRSELRVRLERERRKMRRDYIAPQAKVAAGYTSSMIAKWKARREGFDEVLLIDEHGDVAEGPTTNVFVVSPEGRLRTPPTERILEGVTRASILAIAKHDGCEVSEERIHPDELFESAEVFLTGTTAGVWPVTSIDDRTIGDGRAGPVSRRLRDRFDQVTSGRDPDFEHWLSYVGRRG